MSLIVVHTGLPRPPCKPMVCIRRTTVQRATSKPSRFSCRQTLPYINEQRTSFKLGKFLPGKHIPVVKDEVLLKDNPDIIVILAWHYAKPIAHQLRGMGLKSKLVMPLPEATVWEGDLPA